jgi:hypothetical protein
MVAAVAALTLVTFARLARRLGTRREHRGSKQTGRDRQ